MDGKRTELQKLEKLMAKPGFWDNPEESQDTVKRLKALKSVIDPWADLDQGVEDAEVLLTVAEEEGDQPAAADLEMQRTFLIRLVKDLGLRD